MPRRAEAAGVEALITADRNLEFQQNVARLRLGAIVLMALKTNPEDVLSLAPSVQEALDRITPGRVLHVGSDSHGRRVRRS